MNEHAMPTRTATRPASGAVVWVDCAIRRNIQDAERQGHPVVVAVPNVSQTKPASAAEEPNVATNASLIAVCISFCHCAVVVGTPGTATFPCVGRSIALGRFP